MKTMIVKLSPVPLCNGMFVNESGNLSPEYPDAKEFHSKSEAIAISRKTLSEFKGKAVVKVITDYGLETENVVYWEAK